MAPRSWILVLAGVLCLASPLRADPLLDPLVQGDPDAEALVMAVIAQYPAAVIEVVEKLKRPSPITGESYTLLKLVIDDEDRVTSIRDGSAVVSLTDDLLLTEEAAAIAALAPAYVKMSRALLMQIAAEQGGVLGGPGADAVPFEVLLAAADAADLAAISAALGATPHELFDASVALSTNPPVFRPPLDGSPTPSVLPADLDSYSIAVTLALTELLALGATAQVARIDADLEASLSLGSSVPQIMANVLHGYLMPQGINMVGTTSRLGVLDTGIDDTHPDFNVGGSSIIAETSFLSNSAQFRCDNANSTVCDCPGGNCGGGFVCVGGPRVGLPCSLACAGSGICEDLVGDVHRHGTHVAGTAANQGATVGVAPAAALIGVRILGPDAIGGVVPAAAAFARGAGADVMNASFERGSRCTTPAANAGNRCVVDADCDSMAGGDGDCREHSSDGTHQNSLAFDHEVYQQNIHVAVAAGNSGSVGPVPTTPADAFNVITVGNATDAGGPSASSTPGPTTDSRSKPDVMAPGTTIQSMSHVWEGTNPNTISLSGTSMASPHVAGLLGLLDEWGALNGMLTDTPYLKAAIVNTCTRQTGWLRPGRDQPLDVRQGAGLVNALAAFDAHADDCRIWQQTVTGTAKIDSDWYYVDVDAATAGQEHTFTLVFERHSTQPDSAPKLNDLDLRIYDPSGAIREWSVSGVDSVEHIVLTPGAEGRYCVEVDPFRLDSDGFELYALASSPLPLRFNGNRNPCLREYGDAPDFTSLPGDPGYPTLETQPMGQDPGASHLDWTKEWLGAQPSNIEGETTKAGAVHSLGPVPSVTGENDADGTKDEDGGPNLVDQDSFDDGVSKLPDPWIPGVEHEIVVLVASTVNTTGFVGTMGTPGRYDANNPNKRLYLNAWADWNGTNAWDDPGEQIIGTGSPTGTAAFDPQTWGPNTGFSRGFPPQGNFTLGEAFTDTNGNGKWEPGEPFTDTAGWPFEPRAFKVRTPITGVASDFYLRFRLDFGEDAGQVQNLSGNLGGTRGAAQFGEVEDYHAVGSGLDGSSFVPGETGCGTTNWSDGSCWVGTGGDCLAFPDGDCVAYNEQGFANLDVDASVVLRALRNGSEGVIDLPAPFVLSLPFPNESTNFGQVDVGGILNLQGGAQLSNGFGPHDGLIHVTDGGQVVIQVGGIREGSFLVDPLGTVELNNSALLAPEDCEIEGEIQVNGTATLGDGPDTGCTVKPGGKILVQPASKLQIKDQALIQNEGEIELQNGGELSFTGDNALTGTGTVTLGTGSVVWADDSTTTLTLGGNTVSGCGNLGGGLLQLSLDSPILADDPGCTLTIQPDPDPPQRPSTFSALLEALNLGSLRVLGSELAGSGSGVLRAGTDGNLLLENTSVTGGGIEVAPGGTFTLDASEIYPDYFVGDGTTLVGSVCTLGGSNLSFGAGSTTTLENGALLNLAPGTVLDVDGQMVWGSTGNLTDLVIDTTATLQGSGSLLLSSSLERIRGGGRLTVNGPAISGCGNIGSNFVNVDFLSGGVLGDLPLCTLTLDMPNGVPSVFQTEFAATGGGTLSIFNSLFDGTGGGAIRALDGGVIGITSSTLDNALIEITPNGTMQCQNCNLDPLSFDSFGAMTFSGNNNQLRSDLFVPYVFHPGSATTIANNTWMGFANGGDYVFDGDLFCNSTGNAVTFNIDQDVTWSGSGNLDFSRTACQIRGPSASKLTWDGPHLTGGGVLGFNDVVIDFLSGSVTADDPAQPINVRLRSFLTGLYDIEFEASDGATLGIFNTMMTSGPNGRFLANGGTVSFDQATIDQTQGLGMHAQALNGQDGGITVEDSILIGNILSTDDSSTITLTGNNTITDVTFAGNVSYGDNSSVTFDSDVINQNTLSFGGSTSITITNDVTVSGTGLWNFAWSAGFNRTVINSTSPDFAIDFSDGFVSGSIDWQTSAVVGATTEVVAQGAPGMRFGAPIQMDGKLRAESGSVLTIQDTLSGTGTVETEAGSSLDVGNVSATTDGAWTMGGTLNVNGGDVGTLSILDIGPYGGLILASSLTVGGDFAHALTDESAWSIAPGSVVTLTGGVGAALGDWASWAELEVAGTDLGAGPAGFANNFEIPELHIGPGAQVYLRDLVHNGNRGGGSEALYIDHLVFDDASGRLNTNGLALYFNTLTGDPGQVIDSAVPPPPLVQSELGLAGTAQGGSVSLVVDGVEISVATTAGQSAAQVLQALADAINAHPSLAARGVTASIVQGQLVINAAISQVAIDDPGLTGGVPIPTGTLWALLALALGLILAVARTAARTRA